MKHLRLATVLTAVMLIIAACGSSDGADTTAANGDDGADNEVVMEAISFQPGEITVQAGTEVTWTNNDSVSHTTTSDDDLWDSGTLSPSDTFSFTFNEPGTYTYACTIHPQMQATVIVES